MSRATEDYLEHFRARVLTDAVTEAHADQLERRAARFLAARPRPGDFHGQSTREELSMRWRELTAIAEALRHKAAVVRSIEDVPADVHDAIAEVAA